MTYEYKEGVPSPPHPPAYPGQPPAYPPSNLHHALDDLGQVTCVEEVVAFGGRGQQLLGHRTVDGNGGLQGRARHTGQGGGRGQVPDVMEGGGGGQAGVEGG